MAHRRLFSIGEFSKVAGLTVKTLRFYHEQGLLVPRAVDDQTGYRYYAPEQAETARLIARLRELELPLAEIAEMLREGEDDADVLDHLERHRGEIESRLQKYRRIARDLDNIIRQQREAAGVMNESHFEVEEKAVEPALIAGIRVRGKYSDCGQGFARLGRRFGRHLCGKPFLLHYDSEYHEDDADFEACFPIRKGASGDGVDVRELPGGRVVTLLHKGPYAELGRSYAKIMQYVNDHGYTVELPTREVYHKGPGMIFKGNPKKYLTEIQMPIRD